MNSFDVSLRSIESVSARNFQTISLDDDDWDENFLDSLTEEEAGEEEEFNVAPPVPKIQSFKEAVETVDVLNWQTLPPFYWLEWQEVTVNT